MRVSALLLVSLFCHGHAYFRGSPDIRSYHGPGAGIVGPVVPTRYLCPLTGMSHFPNETRCNGYYLCIEGVGSQQLCPEEMLYNPNTPPNTYPCEDAANVNVTCYLPPPVYLPGPPGPPSVPPLSPLPPTPLPPPPVCPDQVPRHLPAPDSCISFYECRGGEAVPRDCPGDLLYNAISPPSRFPCDYPYNVVCGVSPRPSLSPPSGPFPPQQQKDHEPDQPKKVFNFYTYVTNEW